MKIKIENSTNWFIITAILNFIYAPIVHFYLIDKNFGELFKDTNVTFYSSYIYISIGIIWLIFGGLYMFADNAKYFNFTQKAKQMHFILTISFIIVLMLVPVLEKYYPTTDDNRNSLFSEVFGYFMPFSVMAFFGGIVLFIINLIKAVGSLLLKKS